MIKNTRTSFYLLIFIYISTFTKSGLEKLNNENAQFSCNFDNRSLKLVINNGFIEEEVIKCLYTYNTTEALVFSNSGLQTIPKYLNILTGLINLDLSQNEIGNVSFHGLEQICKNLKRLVLDKNSIHVLRPGNLDCLESLEKLHLANNNLQVIENGTFNKKLKALDYIHAVNNNLTVIDSSIFSKLLLYNNTHMTLNASWNRIYGFTNSANITIEDISKSTNIDIVVTHNNITAVDTEYYFKMFNVTHPFPQLLNLWNSGFDARFNPFICDCALFPLASALRKFYTMDPDNPVFSITCGSPTKLEGMMIRKVQPDQFNCSVIHNCPHTCTCTKTIANGLITVECNDQYNYEDVPMKVPEADVLNINIKSGDLVRLSSREYMHNVTVLDVSQCAIANIDPSIVRILEGVSQRLIYINDNNLENIPETFKKFNFSEGQVLTIDGNPFTCDCKTLWMKKWLLSNKKYVHHQDKIICASGPGKGRPMVEVPDNKFVCQTNLTFIDILFIATGSLFGLILIVSIIAYKLKDSIHIFMISHFDTCKYCLRKRTQRRLVYDIFVPHSCDDDDIVGVIIEMLEGHDPPYKICVGERNFQPGKTISENILTAIESSHTSLLVISNSFLRSVWCNMEFREAHMRFLRDRNINMVLIVLEDLDNDLIYDELRLYMETHVYIKYSDTHFWAKLLKSLPIMLSNDNGSEEASPLIQD